jgi:DNA invertase Pin-like site-specific DNA recombinase
MSDSWAGREVVCYYRVSTQKQAKFGYGLESQRRDVTTFLAGRSATVVAEYTDVETARSRAKATLRKRPALRQALAHCRKRNATLVIARLDRLSRNLAFVSALMETRIEFVAVDLPNATRFMLHIFAAIAEEEGRIIAERTRLALAAAKAKGVRFDQEALRRKEAAQARAEALRTRIEQIRAEGHVTTMAIARELVENGATGPDGEPIRREMVGRYLRRLGLAYQGPSAQERQRAAADERAATIRPHIDAIRAEGFRRTADVQRQLQARGVPTATDADWAHSTTRSVLRRLGR